MNKFLLLIDDKEEFKEDFKTIAQRYGYQIAWGKSFEDLKQKIAQLHLQITAVILDIKCLMTNDQEIEKEDFIGAAINFLSKEYPNVPRMILTGDEKALDGFKMFFNSEIEDIYRKEPEQLDALFQKIDKHYVELPNRLLSYDQLELFKLINEGESKHLEFKSSLQYCTKSQTQNKELRFEVLKNIAAFANSEGGSILIGIDDQKNILGLESTDFLTLKNENIEDEYRLLIDSIIENIFGNDFQKILTDLKFYVYEGKTICRIEVKNKNYSPTFIFRKRKDNSTSKAFFIRCFGSSRELTDVELNKYISAHWK
ncbi:hypothetical protein DRF62_18770 [Chryseobacterium piscium]|uniref:Schlafen AlbA-2 domain-containing protein n=1 Tax=Chryseobacterium piscium TaxID=333702 RepID=A0A3D9BBJ0_9FLAO|nr:ATP-binding protein [Chryseobacterium piscium]REC50682.1 hypothetical protein DRF62_18770 [Chryseobacterium piscium]